jgi:hypothetical protein
VVGIDKGVQLGFWDMPPNMPPPDELLEFELNLLATGLADLITESKRPR